MVLLWWLWMGPSNQDPTHILQSCNAFSFAVPSTLGSNCQSTWGSVLHHAIQWNGVARQVCQFSQDHTTWPCLQLWLHSLCIRLQQFQCFCITHPVNLASVLSFLEWIWARYQEQWSHWFFSICQSYNLCIPRFWGLTSYLDWQKEWTTGHCLRWAFAHTLSPQSFVISQNLPHGSPRFSWQAFHLLSHPVLHLLFLWQGHLKGMAYIQGSHSHSRKYMTRGGSVHWSIDCLHAWPSWTDERFSHKGVLSLCYCFLGSLQWFTIHFVSEITVWRGNLMIQVHIWKLCQTKWCQHSSLPYQQWHLHRQLIQSWHKSKRPNSILLWCQCTPSKWVSREADSRHPRPRANFTNPCTA